MLLAFVRKSVNHLLFACVFVTFSARPISGSTLESFSTRRIPGHSLATVKLTTAPFDFVVCSGIESDLVVA